MAGSERSRVSHVPHDRTQPLTTQRLLREQRNGERRYADPLAVISWDEFFTK